MPPPSVFDYADFRRYLEDWFQARKAANPRFSHRAFGLRVGSRDPSLLVNILRGRRPLAADRLERFVQVLGLEGEAAEYFRLLVRFGQAEDAGIREQAWAAIAELRSRLSAPEIDSARFLYLSNRLYTAVRALAECRGFDGDPAWVARHLDPPVSESEAAEALALLERLGFLVRRDGRLMAADPVLRTSETVGHLGSYGYHRQNHQLAGQILDQLWDPARGLGDRTAFLGFTIAVPESRLADLRRLLWEAHLKIMHQCDAWPEQPDRVVQLSLQMFPVSTSTSDDGKKSGH